MMVTLDGSSLTTADAQRVLFDFEEVQASAESMERVKKSRAAVERIVQEEKTIYGITTGFGKFSDVLIQKEDAADLQLNLILSHACGVGDPFPESVSRAMLLLRANALLKGFSGVRTELIDQLLAYLNHRIHPVIPQQGSLGRAEIWRRFLISHWRLSGKAKSFTKGPGCRQLMLWKRQTFSRPS